MSDSQRTRIFVISLPESTDRRRIFAERAADSCVSWNFFDGCTSLVPGLAYDDADAKQRWGRALTPGELGCYASHYALWTRLLESEADQYLILEDDVIADWRFLELLTHVDFHRSGIDYLRLHCLLPGGMRLVKQRYVANKNLVELRRPAYGTQGYVITRAGAERLREYCSRVLRPIDSQLDRYWEHGLRNLCVFPFPIIEQAGDSLIGDTRREWRKRDLKARVRGGLQTVADRLRRHAWAMSVSWSDGDLRFF